VISQNRGGSGTKTQMLTAIDWVLDGSALLLSVVLAKYVLSLSWRDVGVLIVSCSVYAAHEAWEAGVIFTGTHRAVELFLLRCLS